MGVCDSLEFSYETDYKINSCQILTLGCPQDASLHPAPPPGLLHILNNNVDMILFFFVYLSSMQVSAFYVVLLK